MLENLNIVRDCWWAMPSGNIYPVDENGYLSSHTHGLYKSLNSNDSEYIQDNGSGNFTYYGRLDSSNINVDAVYVTLRASTTPAASAILYINNSEIGGFDVDSIATQDQNFILNSDQQDSIYYGRIDANYDYFAIKLTGETESKLYDLSVSYSGDATWDNYEAGLPNVITGTFLPTNIKSLGDSVWSGSVNDINQYVVESGADNNYITHNNIDTYNNYWSDSFSSPSGGIALYFDDFNSSINVDTFYDEQGLYPGSGVGITQDHLTDITPSGMGGYAVLTDGSNSNISCGNIYSIGLNDVSLMCWIKTNETITSSVAAVGKTAAAVSDHRYYIGLANGGYPRVFFEHEGGSQTINGASSINDNKWHHIAFVLDRDDRLELFCDGQSCGSKSASSYLSDNSQSDFDFNIGWGYDYSNNGDIYIDDARIYLQPLSSGEIMAIVSGVPIDKVPNSQWTFDRQITPKVDPLTQITRAKLNLRMALPPSGDYENARDTFEINGYNHRYKNQDNKEDLTYIDTTYSIEKNGYFTYGAGDIVEAENFTTYSTELNFIDPTINSGSLASTINRNIDMLSNMEFRIIGLPSGTQLSAADLQIEYVPNDCLNLYTTGVAYRCAASSTVDIGISNIYSCGNGGWHHQGYRSYGPTTIEEEIFTNFYTFPESSGYKTYPKNVYTSYFAGDADDSVYGYSVSEVPSRIFSGMSWAPFAREPLRREYYRNPISAADLTPSWYTENRDITNISPSYYRNMMYHGESLEYLDVEMEDGDVSSLNTDSIYSICFEDRVDLTEDFTLYFMLYRHNGMESYGRFFTRSLPRAYGTDEYEIIGDIEPESVKFTVRGDGGYENEIEVSIDQYTKEPILIWFTCGYEERYAEMTTMSLNVHDDVANYFSVPWKTATEYFTGHRKMYSSSFIEHPHSRIEYYGPITVLGTVEKLSFTEQLSRRLYLHHISYCEFGYENEYMDLDPDTNLGANQAYYDMSVANDKRFLSSRLATNLYLQNNPSGVNWVVPYGSGSTEWTSSYNIDNWIDSDTQHSLFNPVSTAGINNLVAPSAIYMDLETTHHTDHPSGVQVLIDVNFDNGSDEHWKVAHLEFSVPSGTDTYRECINKHINMYGGPINYSDLENIDLDITTKYIDVGTEQYYGDLTINSINTYFDNYCIPGDSNESLDLYLYGGAISFPVNPDDGSVDFYTIGSITVTNNTNLYTYGHPHSGSGSLDLYINADQAPMPPVGDPDSTKINLFIEGLDPPNASGNLLLYLWATPSGVSGFSNDMPLYIKSDLDPEHLLPLYLLGEVGEINAAMNLFVGRDPDSVNNLPSGLPLMLQATRGKTEDLDLYIGGAGITDGAGWQSSNMNLFMSRDSEAVAGRLSLYLGQYNVQDDFSLYMNSHETQYSTKFVDEDDEHLLNFGYDQDPLYQYDNILNSANSEILDNDIPDDFCGKSVYVDVFIGANNGFLETLGYNDRLFCFWFKNIDGINYNKRLISSMKPFSTYVGVVNTFVIDLDYTNSAVSGIFRINNTYYSAGADLSLVNDNDWHHYALFADRDDELKIFIDGEQQGAVDISADSGVYIENTAFGRFYNDRFYYGQEGYPASGNFYDMRTYTGKIKDEDIANIINDDYVRLQPGIHYLPNHPEHLSLYISGSGGPTTETLDLYTHGF